MNVEEPFPVREGGALSLCFLSIPLPVSKIYTATRKSFFAFLLARSTRFHPFLKITPFPDFPARCRKHSQKPPSGIAVPTFIKFGTRLELCRHSKKKAFEKPEAIRKAERRLSFFFSNVPPPPVRRQDKYRSLQAEATFRAGPRRDSEHARAPRFRAAGQRGFCDSLISQPPQTCFF